MAALGVTSLPRQGPQGGTVQRKHTWDAQSHAPREPLVHPLPPLFGVLALYANQQPQGDGTVAKKQHSKHIKTNQKHNNNARR